MWDTLPVYGVIGGNAGWPTQRLGQPREDLIKCLIKQLMDIFLKFSPNSKVDVLITAA